MRLRVLIVSCFLAVGVAPGRAIPPQHPVHSATTAAPGAESSDGPAFSASSESLRQAAANVKKDKDADATILLNEERVSLDAEGKLVDVFHWIYRIENEDGVKGWAEVSARWEPWHQVKPEIHARVIATDGSVHTLDPKTLTDVPVHDNSPETYTDQRAYGGPLPAVAVGAIVEEEITTRDTAPFFAAGLVQRLQLSKSVPVEKTRIVMSHAESLPFRFFVHEMPDAKVSKSTENGVETIEIENGRMEAQGERLNYLPPDVIPGAQVEYSWGTSWQKVAAEYDRLTRDKLRSADVQPLLAGMRSASSREGRKQRIDRLVAMLHKNVRYTGVEFGEASIIPQFPAEVLQRKYGDCKDKAALLVTMLRASGIPASLALLDTGPGQDVNPDLPGMGMFDHAIVYVPAAGREPELWIDATAQYTRPGDLPYMDFGRSALIIDEKTTALKKIPELTAEGNVHREFREFTLSDYGPASIVEKNQDSGPAEARGREVYASEDKQVRDNVENYVKREYLADKLTSLQHGDASDLSTPFWVTFKAKGKRGNTDYDNALMAIRVEDLFGGFPSYFTSPGDDKKDEHKEDADDAAPAEKQKPRTQDWQIWPFVNEWNYRIIVPPGYRVRALPQEKEQQLGTGLFTQKYSSNTEGTVVEAVLRFNSGKARLSVTEAKALRDAIVKAQKSDPIFITFDQVGQSFIAGGRIKEGLASYQALIDLHPKGALYRVQLARALLSLGLGEKARTVAREAAALDPNSAQAFSTLGWILQHDLIGRRLKKGLDYEGAVAAYRKAKTLDPKDKSIRANLAILLEYDLSGERYTAKAHLKEAIAEFGELRKMDEEYAAQYDDNVLYDYWYAHDTKGVAETLARLPLTDVRRGFVLAVTAADQGAEAAINKSLQVTTDEEARSKALTSAGWLVIRVHKYGVAADLLTAGARGQSNEAQSAVFADALRKAVPREEFKFDNSGPEGAVQRFFAVAFTGDSQYEDLLKLMSKNSNRNPDPKKDKEDFRRGMYQVRRQIDGGWLPLEIAGDVALANFRFTREGTDSEGYKIRVASMGAEPQDGFVVREDNTYKLLDITNSGHYAAGKIGWQALQELDKNNLAGARKWLDWARELIHINDNDDALAGDSFPHFWTKGREGDAAEIRRAALVLLPSRELRDENLRTLLQMRDDEKNDDRKGRLDLEIAYAYRAQERWSDLLPVAERLTKAYPDSFTAFALAAQAYAGTRRLDDWQKVLDERLPKHADELGYTRSAAFLAMYRGDFVHSRQLLKGLMDQGKATAIDLNSYAWDALFVPPSIDQDSIDAAERANQLTKNSNFAIMHTLACLYARSGKPTRARELLLKAMDAGYLEEPDSSVWLAYGVIAEEYGATDAARAMYGRVDKLKTDEPTSNYQLAQQRLAALGKAGTTTSASAAR